MDKDMKTLKEEEKVIDWLIFDVSTALDEGNYTNKAYSIMGRKALAWLKKYKEQKFINKSENEKEKGNVKSE